MNRIYAHHILDILGHDVTASDFYAVFYEELARRGFEIPVEEDDVVKLLCGLSIDLVAEELYGGSRQSLCDEYGFTKDKAYRLVSFARKNRVFVKKTNATYSGAGADIHIFMEPEVAFSVEVSAETRDEKIEWEETEDGAQACSESARIKTLAQLLEACGVDEKVWEVVDHSVNKWEVGIKVGHGDEADVKVAPLFQVKARLRPRVLEKQRFPALRPIAISVSSLPSVRSVRKPSPLKRALIVPDPQIGFVRNFRTNELVPLHDRRAMDIMLQVAEIVQPDRVEILGDWLDLAEWSDKFTRSPEFAYTTQPSMVEGKWWLAQIRARCENAEIDFLEGNHEKRIQTKLYNHFSSAFGVTVGAEVEGLPIISVDTMLGLSELGINTYEPYPAGEVWINDYVRVIHGEIARANLGKTAEAVLREASETTIYGHIHRVELLSSLNYRRGSSYPIYGFSPGCMCRLDGVVPASKKRINWQQGLGVVYYDENGPDHHIVPIRIHEGKAVFEDAILVGRNHEEQLSDDTRWNLRSSMAYAA